MDYILFEELPATSGKLGLITLNRPKALNALNQEMIVALHQQLESWAGREEISAVIIRSNSEKAFCAGGDIRALYDQHQQTSSVSTEYFHHEYRLNYLVGTYPKPYIALLNGIVMGGGAGVSIHAAYRIACDTLSFAMPETAIGLFTDIGSSHFLTRMPGYLGRYLALTGARINVSDAIYAGIVDHCISYHHFDDLIQALTEVEFSLGSSHDALTKVFQEYAIQPDVSTFKSQQYFTDGIFCGETIDAITSYLKNDDAEWTRAVLANLEQKSPMSLSVTLELLKRAADKDLAFCLEQDYTIVQTMLLGPDFYEGIRAVVVDKDMKPSWRPATLTEVRDDQVKAYFAVKDKKSLDL